MQPGTISSIPGVTSAELYQIGTDTHVDTADTVVAGTADPTHYVITFSGVTAGDYRLVLKIGSTIAGIEPKVTVSSNSWNVAAASSGLDAAGVRAAIGLASANLDSQLSTIDGVVDSILVDTGTTLQAELDGIQADTENIQSRLPAALVGGRIDASVGSMAANTLTASALANDAVTEIQSGLATTSTLAIVAAYIDTEVAAIKAKTDNLPSDPADQSLLMDAINEIANNTGSGARTVTANVILNSLPLQGATVRLSKGAESYVGSTNASGQVVFNVNDGTWQVAITAANASFAGASLVVDGDENPTYALTPMSTPVASDPGKRTVTYTCIGTDGQPLGSTTVYAKCIKAPGTGLALMGSPRSATSDPGGLVAFANCIVGATYEFSMGAGKKISATIPPGSSSLSLESIVGK